MFHFFVLSFSLALAVTYSKYGSFSNEVFFCPHIRSLSLPFNNSNDEK